MRSRDCSECGKPAEPPLVIGRSRIPEELASEAERLGLPMEREFVLCTECLAGKNAEEEYSQELDEKTRSGTICYMCHDELDPPGGTTVWSFDRTQVKRFCLKCKENN